MECLPIKYFFVVPIMQGNKFNKKALDAIR
jgi:hypothetical protein